MAPVEPVDRRLAVDLLLLEREHLLVLPLDSVEQLLSEPEGDPFEPWRGPARSGIDDAVLTLQAARRIPDDLTVRVVLPAGAAPTIRTDHAQAALRRTAIDQCSVGLREAHAVRSMGRRQLPMGITIALISAVVAYSAAAVAAESDTAVLKAVLIILAGLAITVAWVVSWMVVELAMYDWREPAWKARIYELLSRATLEVTTDQEAAD
jgi:hypothetical protein